MSDKSHAGLLYEHCPICLGVLEKKSEQSLEEDSHVTGDTQCKECQKKLDDGMIALIGIVPKEREYSNLEQLTEQEVERDGEIIWIKKEGLKSFVPVPDEIAKENMAFISSEVKNLLKTLISIN